MTRSIIIKYPKVNYRKILQRNPVLIPRVKSGKLFLVLALLISGFASGVFAQVSLGDQSVIDYTRPIEYQIGGITVTGAEYLDKNVLVMLTGLNVGDRVTIPGEDISGAIKKLWDQGLFEDIGLYITDIQGETVFLNLKLKERPRLSRFSLRGINKTEADNLREKLNITRGDVVTESLLKNTRHRIREHFRDKGFLDAEIDIRQNPDTTRANNVVLDIFIKKGNRVRIDEIRIFGNNEFSAQKIKNSLKETKERGKFNPLQDVELALLHNIREILRMNPQGVVDSTMAHFNRTVKIRIFKPSRFIQDKYEEDLVKVIEKYNKVGYRDASIISDSIYRNADRTLSIDLKMAEGRKYYFRNITWVGNTKYTADQLNRVLKIDRGDVYNRELLETNLSFNPNEQDVSSLYLDDGYLFFSAEPVEINVENDSIDIEIRIREGKQARINKVAISGNTKTSDHVVMRELRTRPGQLFSRSDIIRTTRELAQLRYFDPEKITPDIVPNPADGTVDITYKVEETSSDQIELSGGWGYGRIIGTLGLSFNNFSARKLFKSDAWKPVPSGDGQKLSLRLQSYGKGYLSYSASFTEPWLGGKKPNAFSVTYWHSLYSNGKSKNDPLRSEFVIDGLTLGLGRRLTWPDDFFTLYQSVTGQRYALENYSQIFVFGSGTGVYNNINYNIVLGRSSISQPIYATYGSDVSVSLEVTPPYSLFSKDDYSVMEPDERYKWIEYHKWKVNATFFTEIFPKAVIMTRAKLGFLGLYNRDIGITPFERFYLGGDGLSGYNNLDGREIIGMRGYRNETITPDYYKSKNIGGTIYAKYTLELRYPLSLNPSATIYAMAFLEGGNSWLGFDDFNPFSIYRSAGFGVRVFLPMFGLLGLDWGYGFDDVPGLPSANGSQFHFSINSSID
ncbi:MAG TPA: POTRA domain-containing protein [Bacteroidales bacterium]|nr:POTRA domain-containing protein [Bacteroidales bacterium]HOX77577.1 POTRA domain-containing protein [Bacteroidales bacterium]